VRQGGARLQRQRSRVREILSPDSEKTVQRACAECEEEVRLQPEAVEEEELEAVGTGERGGARPAISAAPRQTVRRWSVSGNTATVDRQGDTLWDLAKSQTGHALDWPCIWPTNMQSPRAWDPDYWHYLRVGDEFDISNLTATTGQSATFTFSGAGTYLTAAAALYPGTDPTALLTEIELLAGNGGTPIQNLTVVGHAGGTRMWGDSSNFDPSGLNAEAPAPDGAGAHNQNGPRRCWFTKNARARFVGCSSQGVAGAFRDSFLRDGARALGTNHWLCGWQQTAPTAATFMSVEGPPCNWPPTATRLNTAADVNSAAGLWETFDGTR